MTTNKKEQTSQKQKRLLFHGLIRLWLRNSESRCRATRLPLPHSARSESFALLVRQTGTLTVLCQRSIQSRNRFLCFAYACSFSLLFFHLSEHIRYVHVNIRSLNSFGIFPRLYSLTCNSSVICIKKSALHKAREV